MKVSKDLVLRNIAGEYILVPVGSAAQKIHGIINLTESAQALWKMLQEDCTEETLVEVLLSEYDVDRETAENDVCAFIAQVKQLGILE